MQPEPRSAASVWYLCIGCGPKGWFMPSPDCPDQESQRNLFVYATHHARSWISDACTSHNSPIQRYTSSYMHIAATVDWLPIEVCGVCVGEGGTFVFAFVFQPLYRLNYYWPLWKSKRNQPHLSLMTQNFEDYRVNVTLEKFKQF